MYVYIIDNKVRELIPDIDPSFPHIDISERYPSDMLEKCIHLKDDSDIEPGMVYNPETADFYKPNAPITRDIAALKEIKIAESKEKLAEWLYENPMTYTDGKNYSVTAEKQSLLNSNLASYERAKAAGITYPLKWNASGEECTAWTYEDLVALSLSIAAYVAPRVSKQQEIEIFINACTAADDLDSIEVSYE